MHSEHRRPQVAPRSRFGQMLLMRGFVFFIIQWIVERVGGRHRLFLSGPGAQVDLLAAIRTEGAEGIGLGPFDFGGAGRAVNNGHGKNN